MSYTSSRSMELIRRCSDDIAEFWPRGMEVDGDVAERFDTALVKAIADDDVPAVETHCERYRNWMARQATKHAYGR